jgi:peptidoglycan/LPS O-acetylase OafA/YrhL
MGRRSREGPAPSWARTPTDRARGAQLWISFGLIAAGLVFSREASFPMPWALAAVLGTAGAIDAAVMAGGGRPVRVLSAAVPVWIGTRSYSLYLWHWPVYVLFRWTVGLESLATRIVAVALIAALAEASYRWVETPFRRGFRSRCPRQAPAPLLSERDATGPDLVSRRLGCRGRCRRWLPRIALLRAVRRWRAIEIASQRMSGARRAVVRDGQLARPRVHHTACETHPRATL